jgi:hypothetical protein
MNIVSEPEDKPWKLREFVAASQVRAASLISRMMLLERMPVDTGIRLPAATSFREALTVANALV